MRTRENAREEHMMAITRAIIKQLKLVVACVMLIMLRESIVHADNDDVDDVKESYVQLSRHRTSLQGKELRVVTGHFPPVMFISKNNFSGVGTDYSGILYEQLLFLSKKLNFKYKIFPATVNTVGVNRNGSWNGVIGTILKGEADIGLVPVAIALNRYEAIDFCGRMGGDYTTLLVRYPAATISFTSAYDVFSKEIWIGLLTSLVVIVGVWKVITCIEKRLFQSELGLIRQLTMKSGDVAWYMFSTIISQGGYFRSTRNAQKFLAATWCLAAFVLVNIYSSTLTSYMSLTFQKPEINSFKDLAASASYQATVAIGSIQELDVMDSSVRNSDMKLVGDKIRRCSNCRKSDRDAMVETVLNKENYVAIMVASAANSFMQIYNKNEKNCRLTMSQEKVSWKPMFLAVPKSFPYKEEINLEMLWFIDSGLKEYWYGKYDKMPDLCRLKYNRKGVSINKRSNNRITLNQFYLPFLILFGGYLLAFMQFCRERLYPPR